MDEAAALKKINAGLGQLNLALPLHRQALLLTHLKLLQKWGRVYNLSAIRTMPELIPKHLLDSLTIAPFILGDRILDLGSGAGFPGIPLAVYYPEKQFVLLDSQIKKVCFLRQVKQSLKLTNIEIVHARIEDRVSDTCFSTITVRALGPSIKVVQKSMHLCCNNGCMLVMKGRHLAHELADLATLAHPVRVVRLSVPELLAKRQLIIIKNT